MCFLDLLDLIWRWCINCHYCTSLLSSRHVLLVALHMWFCVSNTTVLASWDSRSFSESLGEESVSNYFTYMAMAGTFLSIVPAYGAYFAWFNSTNTSSSENSKINVNSILFHPDTTFSCFCVEHFYLEMPLDCPGYVRIKPFDIPKEFFQECNLLDYVHESWVVFEIRKGVCGLPQSRILASKLLKTQHNAASY